MAPTSTLHYTKYGVNDILQQNRIRDLASKALKPRNCPFCAPSLWQTNGNIGKCYQIKTLNCSLNIIGIFCACMSIDTRIKVPGRNKTRRFISEGSTKKMAVVDEISF